MKIKMILNDDIKVIFNVDRRDFSGLLEKKNWL